MNRSWLIALGSTVVLAVAVAFELRGLWRPDDRPPAEDGPAAPAEPALPEAPTTTPLSTARLEPSQTEAADLADAGRGRDPFPQPSGVTRLPQVDRKEPAAPSESASPIFDALRALAPTGRAEPLAAPAGPAGVAEPAGDPWDEAGLVTRIPRLDPEVPFAPPPLPGSRTPMRMVATPSSPPGPALERLQPPVERLPRPEPRAPAAPAEILPLTPPEPAVARHTGAWWAPLVLHPQRDDSEPRPLDVATLIQETILHSEHVQAVSVQAQVAETEIVQADAVFDPAAFVDSKWIDSSDPVGNVLTTGGPPRLSREEWSSSIGFRRKTRSGGDFEIAQRLVGEDNNSIFFVPADQATSRLTVSLNQPLLKGGGRAVNRSLILLAMHDTQIARDRFRSELETQVLRVVREYWELYYQRCVLLQQRSALRQAEEILEVIRARASFDSLESQVQRVRATVAIRNAHIVRAQAAIRNAESRLRALSNSPLLGGVSVELLPVEPPLREKITLPGEDARKMALANRTEVDAALTRVRAASVEVGISRNELLPSLGLVLEAYVSGLEGNFDLAGSLGEQFTEGAPSYTAALLYEAPLWRRREKAFHRQKVLELRQAEHRFRDSIATLSSEVEIALREVETTWQELVARRESADATSAEVEYLRARLDHIPGEDNRAVSFLLEELLNAIDRLVRDESELASAQRNYAVSIAEFYRATGMLVAVEATLGACK